MAMSKYETIIWEEKMKEKIQSLARATYANSFSDESLFDVIQTTGRLRISVLSSTGILSTHSHDTHLVVYKSHTTTSDMEYIVTVQCVSFAEGLEALLSKTQAQLGDSIEQVKDARVASGGNCDIHYDSEDSEIDTETANNRARYDRVKGALGNLWTSTRE